MNYNIEKYFIYCLQYVKTNATPAVVPPTAPASGAPVKTNIYEVTDIFYIIFVL